jgi:hypothetical protein
MSLSRRRFLETASLSVLVGAALPRMFAQESRESVEERYSPERLAPFTGISAEKFRPLIGQAFRITASTGASYSWTLTDVKAVTAEDAASAKLPAQELQTQALPTRLNPTLPSQPPMNTFTVSFRGSGESLPQDTYTVEHAALGAFPLFLVPGSPAANPPTYSAVFSLLNQKPADPFASDVRGVTGAQLRPGVIVR